MIRKLLIICLVLFFRGAVSAQEFAKLDLFDNEDYSSFFLLDAKLEGKKMVMLAQNKEYKTTNALLGLKMMKHLHQKAGFRHYLLDAGTGEALIVDRYVQSGDSLLYELMVDVFPKEYLVWFRGLHHYNRKLSETEKIRIHGICAEYNPGMAMVAIHQLLPMDEAPDDIRTSVEVLKKGSAIYRNNLQYAVSKNRYRNNQRIGGYDFEATLKLVLNDVDSNRRSFETFLGHNFQDFMRICDGLRAAFEVNELRYAAAMQADILDEQYVYNRIKSIASDHPQEKFFMQYNYCRNQDASDGYCNNFVGDYVSLNEKMKNDSVFSKKLLSIRSMNCDRSSELCFLNSEFPEIEERLDDEGLTMIDFSGSADKTRYEWFSESDLYIENRAYPLSDGTKEGNEEWLKSRRESEYTDAGIFYDFRYTRSFYDFASLNRTLFGSAAKGFGSYAEFYGGGFTLMIDRFYWTIGMDGMKKQEVQQNDSLKFRLSAFSFNWRMGGDLFESKYFDLSPYLGIGFARMQLRSEELLADTVYSGVFGFSDVRQYTVNNPAVLLQSGLDLRINLGFIFIGVNASHQWDVSNKKFRYQGEIDMNSPYTSHRGFVVSAQCGLYVKM